jgi:hypothetical protein
MFDTTKKIFGLCWWMLMFYFLGTEASSQYHHENVTQCTDLQTETLFKMFFYGHHVFDKSKCPVESWLEKMAAVDTKNMNKVFINIGVNKGYNFAVWMNVFAQWTSSTPKTWFDSLSILSPNMTGKSCGGDHCGCCKDCHSTFDTANIPQLLPDMKKPSILMVGVDLNNNTIELLGSVLDSIKSEPTKHNLEGITFHIQHAAGQLHSLIIFNLNFLNCFSSAQFRINPVQ